MSPPPFVIVRELGAGGMGRVFLVLRREGRFERAYALKRLRSELLHDEAARLAFLDEARLAGLLTHPNIVRVFDVGSDAEGPFLLMDYIEGATLSRIIKSALQSGDEIPLSVALEWMRDVALGLDAAHDARDMYGRRVELIHRDISPDNILVGTDGIARVTDFGIAKASGRAGATTQNVIKGKRGYLAPEILKFEEPGIGADLWSFGVVLFELLTQRRLYAGADGVRRACSEAPPDLLEELPDAAPELVVLLFSLLAKSPSSRPPSFAAVHDILESVLAQSTHDETTLACDFMATFTA